MKYILQFDPIIYFTLTRGQFDLILENAKHHYDVEIKQAAKPKGWLSEMQYQFTFYNKDVAELQLDLFQTGKIIKSLEMSRSEESRPISARLNEAYSKAIEYKEKINKEFAEKEF